MVADGLVRETTVLGGVRGSSIWKIFVDAMSVLKAQQCVVSREVGLVLSSVEVDYNVCV